MLRPEANRAPHKVCDVDVHDVDRTRYPGFDYLDHYEVVLEPGDVLYVGAYAWHHVENLTPSIGFGARWTAPKNSRAQCRLLNGLEYLNTNPSPLRILRMFRESGEVDFNRVLLATHGIEVPKTAMLFPHPPGTLKSRTESAAQSERPEHPEHIGAE